MRRAHQIRHQLTTLFKPLVRTAHPTQVIYFHDIFNFLIPNRCL
ncbi:hypothetical protein [Alysiella crassa]|nr:hypothetical protein [Alysiella crassa]